MKRWVAIAAWDYFVIAVGLASAGARAAPVNDASTTPVNDAGTAGGTGTTME